MKKMGEDIIITETGEMELARKRAIALSKSQNHSYASVWYICTQKKQLRRDQYREGKLESYQMPANNLWWDGKITILDALKKHGNDRISKQAQRLINN